MRKLFTTVLIILLGCSLNSCNFFYNLSSYRSTTETFTNALINRNFDKCISLMAMEKASNVNLSQFKIGLDTFRSVIVRNFGTKLDYTFINAEKKFSLDKEDNLPPNTTLVLIEFHNTKEVGVLQVLFDDKTAKIENIKTLDVKQPIPDMMKFWLFGLFAIIVLALNIYTIVMVKRSNLKKKWLSYIAIILLNVPTIQYSAANGLFFKLLYFQFLLGVSFESGGYLSSGWAIGIPIGAIFILWKLRSPREEELTPELLAEQYGQNYLGNPSTEPKVDHTENSGDEHI